MSCLEIRKFKDRVLRKKAEEVKEITSEIKELVFDMIETMKKNEGIGLAGNQVGVLKRVIIVPENLKSDRALALINPKIIKKSREKSVLEEGCLSFPNIFLTIKRAKRVEVRALNIEGKEIVLKGEGIMAHIFQHEIDHLDGILFFDRLPLRKRIVFKIKNLNKIPF